jgi:hypothetical protein
MVDVTSIINGSLNNINWSDIFSKIPGFQTLVNIGVALGLLLIVYIVFLIIRSITQILYSLRFKKVAKNVEEINQKMDILISKLGGKNSESKATKNKK